MCVRPETSVTDATPKLSTKNTISLPESPSVSGS